MQSSHRGHEYKFQLPTPKKGIFSMKYLMMIKAICGTLAVCGRPVSKEDEVLSMLDGL